MTAADPVPPAAPIRLLVVEDNQLMRMGILSLLSSQPDVQVVGEAADGVEALALFRTLAPNVVLMDLRMPKLDGVAAIAALCRDHPDARVLVLTHYDGEEAIFRAVQAGARGYVTKEFGGDEILRAIRAVAAGERHLPDGIALRLVDRERNPLNVRERQVLDGIARGLTNRQIGAELGLTEKTAGLYVSQLIKKLGARSRTDALATALRRGLLPPG